MSSKNSSSAMQNLAALLDTGDYSDVTIKCSNGREFKVHKAVICPASPVLTAAFKHGMKEQTTGVVEHTAFDADTIERVLNFIYKQKYSVKNVSGGVPKKDEPGGDVAKDNKKVEPAIKEETIDNDHNATDDSESVTVADEEKHDDTEPDKKPEQTNKPEDASPPSTELMAHVKVFEAAHYYGIIPLTELAADLFADKAAAGFTVLDFINVVNDVCDNLPSDCLLWKALVNITVSNSRQLFLNKDFMENLWSIDGEFLTKVLQATYDRSLSVENRRKAVAISADIVIGDQKAQIADLKRTIEKKDETIKSRDEMTSDLIRTLRNMPTSCKNVNCERQFDRLSFEQKRDGNWRVRCQRCRCNFGC